MTFNSCSCCREFVLSTIQIQHISCKCWQPKVKTFSVHLTHEFALQKFASNGGPYIHVISHKDKTPKACTFLLRNATCDQHNLREYVTSQTVLTRTLTRHRICSHCCQAKHQEAPRCRQESQVRWRSGQLPLSLPRHPTLSTTGELGPL